jgi:hypothetical protein
MLTISLALIAQLSIPGQRGFVQVPDRGFGQRKETE